MCAPAPGGGRVRHPEKARVFLGKSLKRRAGPDELGDAKGLSGASRRHSGGNRDEHRLDDQDRASGLLTLI